MKYLTLDKLPKKALAKIDLQTAFMASRCVVAAERLRLFRKLYGKEMTSAEIGRMVGIRGFRREPFLAALLGMGLLVKKGDRYRNSALADKYFVRDRSIYWTDIYSDECVEEYRAFSVLEEMLTTGRDYESIMGIKRDYYLDKMKNDYKWARGFTHMLYHYHQPSANVLARLVDLAKYRNLLDVGGGSGVMSMALVRRFPNLKATILDMATVCRAAKGLIRENKLTKRIKTMVGDMNKKIPGGYDVIMFCDSGGHIPEILKRTYNALPEGGLLILTDSFSSDDLTEPFTRLMWQLRSQKTWLTTAKEAEKNVKAAGFRIVRRRRLHDNEWLITARR